MIVHPHGFARAAIAALLLLGFYFHKYLSGAKSIFQSAICDRNWAATDACETSNFSNNAPNATLKATVTESIYSVENLITNSTLGFQEVLAIGLPERSDKRDLLTLMSTFQDVKLTWMNAIKGSDISRKVWPNSWVSHKGWDVNLTVAELGNWRSHCNALRKVIDDDLSTALILEDDVDWDVSFKSQLTQFALATRAIENQELSSTDLLNASTETTTPYGNSWDVLLVGTCANPPFGAGAVRFLGDDDQTHSVSQVNGGFACTYGYGVTQTSARMLLGHLLDLSTPTDMAMGKFCKNHQCLQVWPQLISSYKPAGSRQKDSDINEETEVTDEIREHGETWNIKNSAVTDMLRKVSKDGPSPA